MSGDDEAAIAVQRKVLAEAQVRGAALVRGDNDGLWWPVDVRMWRNLKDARAALETIDLRIVTEGEQPEPRITNTTGLKL